MIIPPSFLSKYDVPVPRYTSYPTVPYWNESIDTNLWWEKFSDKFQVSNHAEGISLYIHLPFCESLCTYCGCNKKITTNHSVEHPYIQTILREWSLYLKHMNAKPIIRELHLGGGTPTFFSPEHLKVLINGILEKGIIHPHHEFSFEGHPNNTTSEHLQTLYDLGFRRVSYGVQDLDPEVQRIINRIQPFEKVDEAIKHARKIGYTSVNLDLIYGLPKQNINSIINTIEQVLQLKPDRIAFYSYAHVPWTNKGQRLFNEDDLPGPEEKMNLYITGKKLFTDTGFHDIGMDHFALPTDELFIASKEEKLHRNFMGYTTQKTTILIGLGVSSISDIGNGFAQNSKLLHDYTEITDAGNISITKGYFLNEEDIRFRKYILDISCKGQTNFQKTDLEKLQQISFPLLANMQKDELLSYDEEQLLLTPLGRHFIRNICSAFDLKLYQSAPDKDVVQPQIKFSRAV